ncbi:TonB family protein [Pedobacter sp. KR3-3]|uniref:TonB family protein n=1 Tax=Pedobacter albus TaxID=3113905 RepID=A0ABU7IAS9_9SPHI|nr:TonB family protein [Pedobacter sp. KR3-3]MEE1946577.1 TonB family protein [Pedobacter sp. KR3-3]
MKKLFLLALLVYSTGLFAQTDTTVVYVDVKNRTVTRLKDAVLIYKAYQKDSTSYVVSTHNKFDEILTKTTYADVALTIRNGSYIEYKHGRPSLKGMYANNLRTGVFINYDTLGKATETRSFVNDLLNGPYYLYSNNGTVVKTGIYKNDKKIGDWFTYYDDGKLAMNEKYDDDSKLVNALYLDSLGNKTTREMIEMPPSFPGGVDKFYQFLGEKIRYPSVAAYRGITGTVIVSFVITETGKLENIKIGQSLEPSLDEEALRVVRLSPKWIPGKMGGKIVRVNYTIPIKFSIR